jgi:glycosyltransferase involved in cell wall biosynthesis
MARPFFSAVLCVHNGERYVERAIESVLAQTDGDWELVIVDDASTDGTPRILRRYAARDRRVRLVRNETNLHVGASANRGIRETRGVWIPRIDADDVWRPNFLERVRPHAERVGDPDCFFSSSVSIIDEDDRKIMDLDLPPGPTVKRMMPFENFLIHSATVFPRVLWEKAGGYPEKRARGCDAALWRRFFAAGASVIMIPEFLVYYRIHLQNLTSAKWGKRGIASGGWRENAEWKASLYLKQGLSVEARRELAELREKHGGLSLKNRFYLWLTYLPPQVITFLMWEVRPFLRYLARRFRVLGRKVR